MVRPYQKNNLYFDKNGDYVASTGYAQIKTKQSSRFLYQYLHLKKFVDEVIERCTGTSYPAINSKDLAKISIFYPPLPEQQKIASFFTAIDRKISQLKRKLTLLEQYKKGVMQKIFSQQIRFKDDNGKEFPKWEKKKLGEVCDCLDNFRQPLNDAERQKMQGDIPYWGANNIMDYVNDYIFDETIVLLAEDGGNFNDYMTRPIANISFGKCWVNNHTHVLRGKSNLSNEFLFYSLVHKDITGFVSGGTRTKLTKGEMFKIPINTPFLTEQSKIANFLSAIDDKINHTRKQIEKAEVWKKGLMQQMFV
jgi:type I restriction enzyme S subunit